MSAPATSANDGSCLLPTVLAQRNTGRYGRGNPKLEAALHLLPTLTVHGNYNREGSTKKSGDGLATAIRRLPTLCAIDHKGSAGQKLTRRSYKRLPTALAHLLPTVCASDYKAPYSAAGYLTQTQKRSKPLRDTLAHAIGHRLTSAFAEWWMGWPLGWTGSSAAATAKSRSKRRPRG